MHDEFKGMFLFRENSAGGETWLTYREPGGTKYSVLCDQNSPGTSAKPILVQTSEYRSLCFSLDGAVQSEMRIDDPDDLICSYTRKMMGFLLFCPQPQAMLMIGLGGGSLVKYCRRHVPSTPLTVVEIDSNVIALRSHFQIPPDDSCLSVVNRDGAEHLAALARSKERTDVLLVDAFDRDGIAPAVTTMRFLRHAHSVLTPRGVFVMNLVASSERIVRLLGKIRRVFGGPVIPVCVELNGNVVVFAGGALQDRQRMAAVARNSRSIETRLGLLFPNLVRMTDEWISDVAAK